MSKVNDDMINLVSAKLSGPVGSSTAVHNNGKIALVLLHGHNIATVIYGEPGASEEILEIRDCGYKTQTAKSRLNSLLTFYVGFGWELVQRQGDWTLKSPDGETREWDGNASFQFGRLLC